MRGLSAKGRAGLRIVSVVLGLGILSGRMTPAEGAEPVTDHQVITLWPGGAPGAMGNNPEQDIPTLTIWLAKPEAATGAAVVVCPGGGYGMLASDHEGRQVAEWLNSLGVSAFVLKYRLGPRYHHPAMAPGRRTGDPDGPGSRPEMGRRPAPDRHSRIFRGRASGLDGRHSCSMPASRTPRIRWNASAPDPTVRDRSQPGVPGMAQALRDLAQGPGFPRPRWRSCVSGRPVTLK